MVLSRNSKPGSVLAETSNWKELIPATAMSSQRSPRELPESSQRAPRELSSPSLSEICVLISLSKTADKQSFLGTTWGY